jgi:hypothetical protein
MSVKFDVTFRGRGEDAGSVFFTLDQAFHCIPVNKPLKESKVRTNVNVESRFNGYRNLYPVHEDTRQTIPRDSYLIIYHFQPGHSISGGPVRVKTSQRRILLHTLASNPGSSFSFKFRDGTFGITISKPKVDFDFSSVPLDQLSDTDKNDDRLNKTLIHPFYNNIKKYMNNHFRFQDGWIKQLQWYYAPQQGIRKPNVYFLLYSKIYTNEPFWTNLYNQCVDHYQVAGIKVDEKTCWVDMVSRIASLGVMYTSDLYGDDFFEPWYNLAGDCEDTSVLTYMMFKAFTQHTPFKNPELESMRRIALNYIPFLCATEVGDIKVRKTRRSNRTAHMFLVYIPWDQFMRMCTDTKITERMSLDENFTLKNLSMYCVETTNMVECSGKSAPFNRGNMRYVTGLEGLVTMHYLNHKQPEFYQRISNIFTSYFIDHDYFPGESSPFGFFASPPGNEVRGRLEYGAPFSKFIFGQGVVTSHPYISPELLKHSEFCARCKPPSPKFYVRNGKHAVQYRGEPIMKIQTNKELLDLAEMIQSWKPKSNYNGTSDRIVTYFNSHLRYAPEFLNNLKRKVQHQHVKNIEVSYQRLLHHASVIRVVFHVDI